MKKVDGMAQQRLSGVPLGCFTGEGSARIRTEQPRVKNFWRGLEDFYHRSPRWPRMDELIILRRLSIVNHIWKPQFVVPI